MPYTMKPLTPALVDDFFRFFDTIAFAEHPEWGCECYCCFYHATDLAVWDTVTGEINKAAARDMILNDQMHGLLAYDGDTPVGWCHYDRLANLPGARLFYAELASKDDTRALIACFTIAQGHRRRGIADMLLGGALADLQAMGIKTAEAYPAVENSSDEHNYHGPLSLYEKHGFTAVRQIEHNMLVEKQL